MEIKLIREKEDNLDAVLVVNISLFDFEEEAIKKLKNQKQKVNLPGFRPGKVPMGIAKKYLWEGIVKEELENKLEKSIESYFKDNSIEYLKPLLPIMSDKKIDLAADKEFDFSYDIGLLNKLEIDTNTILSKVVKYEIEESQADIDQEIDLIRNAYGAMDYPEIIEDNPELSLYFELSELNTEGEKLEEGIQKSISKKFKELPEKLQKLLIGETKTSSLNIDIDAVFESRKYFSEFMGIEKLEAEDAENSFSLQIKSVHIYTKAELNEYLYSQATQGTGKTKEEFEIYVKNLVNLNNNNKSEHMLTDDISETLLKSIEIPLPEKFADRLFQEEKKEQIKEMEEDKIKEEKEKYYESIKFSLIIKHYVDKFEIKAEEREIVQEAYFYIKNFYMQYGMNNTEEEMKEKITKFLKSVDNISFMQNRIENRKVFDKLMAETEFKTKKVSLEEFNKIHDKKHKHHDHD